MISTDNKDALLCEFLPTLGAQRYFREWHHSKTPYSDLQRDCQGVANDKASLKEIGSYLCSNPVIQMTTDSLLTYMAGATCKRTHDEDEEMARLEEQGQAIVAWLPSFLIIDGPLGRFLTDSASPLNELLRRERQRYPTLAQACELFNNPRFRKARNAFGHWAFHLTYDKGGSHALIRGIDWNTGDTTAELTLREADALHLASFAIIECLDNQVFRIANPMGEAP